MSCPDLNRQVIPKSLSSDCNIDQGQGPLEPELLSLYVIIPPKNLMKRPKLIIIYSMEHEERRNIPSTEWHQAADTSGFANWT